MHTFVNKFNLTGISKAITLTAIALINSACTTKSLEVNYDIANKDFSAYQSVKVETLNDNQKRVVSMLSKAIESKMKEKGYQLSHKPDLVVVYQVELERGQRVEQEQIPVMGRLYTRPKLEAVNKASILVNAYDPKADRVVWKASSSREVTHVNPKNIDQARVNERIGELFESFPSK